MSKTMLNQKLNSLQSLPTELEKHKYPSILDTEEHFHIEEH